MSLFDSITWRFSGHRGFKTMQDDADGVSVVVGKHDGHDIRVCRIGLFSRRHFTDLQISSAQAKFLPRIKRILKRYRAKRDACEFGVYLGDTPVGYFQLNFSRRETSHYVPDATLCGLEAMCVDKRFQARGLGVAALSSLAQLVPQTRSGIDGVHLTVACENQRAINVYEKAGFKHTGQIVQLPHDLDQYVMALTLKR